MLPAVVLSCVCAHAWNEPVLSITNVHVSRLTLERMTVSTSVVVGNPNNVPLRVTALDYTLDAGTSRVTQARYPAAFVAAAHSSVAIAMPVQVPFDYLHAAAGGPQAGPRTPYRLVCGVSYEAQGQAPARTVVERRGMLPVISAPVIKLKSLRVSNLTLEAADVVVALLVSNPNTFGITVNRLTYDLALDNEQWARGAFPARLELPAQRATTVNVPVSLARGMVRALPGMVARGEPVRYRLHGYLDAQTTLPELRTLSMPYDRSGMVNLRDLARGAGR